MPIVPDRVAGAVGGRSWRWLAPTQMLGRLRLLLGRSAAARAIVNRPFWQKAPAASASDPFEPEDALSPRELPPVVQAVERVDKAEAPLGPSCSAAAASPAAVVFVRSEAKPEMAEPGAPLFVAKTAGEVSAKVRGEFHLGQGEPIFLFAGEMSYAAGADLLTDALITVCQDHQEVQFALVGDGSLRSDLEAQVERAGFTHRCRFTGSLLPDAFERLLTTCDALVIPARERQDSRLAERVALLGKPLLTTHQAQIRGIVHGQNGLVAYDCANSLVGVCVS